MSSATWLGDLLGRLIYAYQLPPEPIAAACDTALSAIVVAAAGDAAALHDCPRLPLVVNIIVRLELRLAGDSKAIRTALETPLDVLDGATPAAMMRGSLDDLRRVRLAIDHVVVPPERWWRTGHR